MVDFILMSCIDTFLVAENRGINNFENLACCQIVKNVNMQSFLLINYSNYVAFDEALALLDRLKKSNSKNYKRSNILEVALDNLIVKMLYF